VIREPRWSCLYNLWCCEFDTCWLHNVMWYGSLGGHVCMISKVVKLTGPLRLPYHIILWSQHLSNSQHQRLYKHYHRGSRITLYYGVNTCQTHNIRDYTYMTTEAPVSHYIMESTPVKLTTSEIIHTWPPRLPYHIILWSQHQSTSQHQKSDWCWLHNIMWYGSLGGHVCIISDVVSLTGVDSII
jgi:hypothetical protein